MLACAKTALIQMRIRECVTLGEREGTSSLVDDIHIV